MIKDGEKVALPIENNGFDLKTLNPLPNTE